METKVPAVRSQAFQNTPHWSFIVVIQTSGGTTGAEPQVLTVSKARMEICTRPLSKVTRLERNIADYYQNPPYTVSHTQHKAKKNLPEKILMDRVSCRPSYTEQCHIRAPCDYLISQMTGTELLRAFSILRLHVPSISLVLCFVNSLGASTLLGKRFMFDTEYTKDSN